MNEGFSLLINIPQNCTDNTLIKKYCMLHHYVLAQQMTGLRNK